MRGWESAGLERGWERKSWEESSEGAVERRWEGGMEGAVFSLPEPGTTAAREARREGHSWV